MSLVGDIWSRALIQPIHILREMNQDPVMEEEPHEFENDADAELSGMAYQEDQRGVEIAPGGDDYGQYN